MAKKATKLKSAASTVANAPADVAYKPRLYLDLQDESVDQVAKLKVGETVELVVRGKIVRLGQNERSEGGKKVKAGEIALENYEVETMEEEMNEFTKMAKEEDSEEG